MVEEIDTADNGADMLTVSLFFCGALGTLLVSVPTLDFIRRLLPSLRMLTVSLFFCGALGTLLVSAPTLDFIRRSLSPAFRS